MFWLFGALFSPLERNGTPERETAGGEWHGGQMGYFLSGGHCAIRVFITCAPSGGHQRPPVFRSSPLGSRKGLAGEIVSRLLALDAPLHQPPSTLCPCCSMLYLLGSQVGGNTQPFIYFWWLAKTHVESLLCSYGVIIWGCLLSLTSASDLLQLPQGVWTKKTGSVIIIIITFN